MTDNRKSDLAVIDPRYEHAVLEGFFALFPPICPYCDAQMVVRHKDLTSYCWCCDHDTRRDR